MKKSKKKNEKKEESEKPPTFVKLSRIYKDIDWHKFKNKPVIPFGADTPTNNLVGNLENLLCTFVVGKRSSEREMFIHSSIVNILKNTNPQEFKLILIDTKKTNLKAYKNLPNLYFPLIEDKEDAKNAIDWCVAEVNRRFKLLLEGGEVFLADYNKKFKRYKIPRILMVITDYADLSKKDARYMKKSLYSINAFGSLSGVHLLICSSGISKENCPSRFSKAFYRVAFKTNSSAESKLIIGTEGAEKLKGRGDAIFKAPSNNEIRPIQSFSVSKKEIKKTINSIK